MSKFKMWWALKGEEKTKRIIGRTCRSLCLCVLIFIAWSVIIGSIVEYGSVAVAWWAIGILVVAILFVAIFWGDKVKNG